MSQVYSLCLQHGAADTAVIYDWLILRLAKIDPALSALGPTQTPRLDS